MPLTVSFFDDGPTGEVSDDGRTTKVSGTYHVTKIDSLDRAERWVRFYEREANGPYGKIYETKREVFREVHRLMVERQEAKS